MIPWDSFLRQADDYFRENIRELCSLGNLYHLSKFSTKITSL